MRVLEYAMRAHVQERMSGPSKSERVPCTHLLLHVHMNFDQIEQLIQVQSSGRSALFRSGSVVRQGVIALLQRRVRCLQTWWRAGAIGCWLVHRALRPEGTALLPELQMQADKAAACTLTIFANCLAANSALCSS